MPAMNLSLSMKSFWSETETSAYPNNQLLVDNEERLVSWLTVPG